MNLELISIPTNTHPLDGLYAKVVLGQMRSQRRGQPASLFNCRARFVHRKNFKAAPEQIDEIAARATTGIEHSHPRNDSPLQELIEKVNVDVAEL